MPNTHDRSRREFLKALGLGAAGLALPAMRTALAADPPDSAAKRPNFLFILTDDQRKDTVAALGNPHIKTPNLDRLVHEGTVLRNAYCMGGFSGAVCLPSRMMTLRGRSWFNVRGQGRELPNFPASMKQAGYETFHLGKKGNADGQVHKHFEHSGYVDRSPEPGKPLADGAIQFLKARKKDRPFFMYLAGPAPHDPRIAPQPYMDMYDPAKLPVPPNFRPFHPFDNGEMLIRDEKLASWPRTEQNIREQTRDYYAMITHLDAQLGRIFQTLKDLGEYDDTVIIFSNDQGIALGSHGLMGKQNLYEHSMGVAMIFRGPGIPRGQTRDAFAYLFDVFPTVCELAGAKAPDGLDGRSLAPVLRGQKDAVRDTVLLAYKDLQRAVRRGPWKLLVYPKINRMQLFNLQEDPFEKKDLAADPAQAARVKELLGVLAEQQKLYGDGLALGEPRATGGEVDLGFFSQARKPRK